MERRSAKQPLSLWRRTFCNRYNICCTSDDAPSVKCGFRLGLNIPAQLYISCQVHKVSLSVLENSTAVIKGVVFDMCMTLL